MLNTIQKLYRLGKGFGYIELMYHFQDGTDRWVLRNCTGEGFIPMREDLFGEVEYDSDNVEELIDRVYEIEIGHK